MKIELLRRLTSVYDARFERAGYPFPFAGYAEILEEARERAHLPEPTRVLDVALGEGDLAAHFHVDGHEIWGVVGEDTEVRARARDRLPELVEIPGPLARIFDDSNSALTGERFTCICAGYALSAHPVERRLDWIARLVETHLAPGGVVVVADVSLETTEELERRRHEWAELWAPWEDELEVWVAERDCRALVERGMRVRHGQASVCGGVYKITAG